MHISITYSGSPSASTDTYEIELVYHRDPTAVKKPPILNKRLDAERRVPSAWNVQLDDCFLSDPALWRPCIVRQVDFDIRPAFKVMRCTFVNGTEYKWRITPRCERDMLQVLNRHRKGEEGKQSSRSRLLDLFNRHVLNKLSRMLPATYDEWYAESNIMNAQQAIHEAGSNLVAHVRNIAWLQDVLVRLYKLIIEKFDTSDDAMQLAGLRKRKYASPSHQTPLSASSEEGSRKKQKFSPSGMEPSNLGAVLDDFLLQSAKISPSVTMPILARLPFKFTKELLHNLLSDISITNRNTGLGKGQSASKKLERLIAIRSCLYEVLKKQAGSMMQRAQAKESMGTEDCSPHEPMALAVQRCQSYLHCGDSSWIAVESGAFWRDVGSLYSLLNERVSYERRQRSATAAQKVQWLKDLSAWTTTLEELQRGLEAQKEKERALIEEKRCRVGVAVQKFQRSWEGNILLIRKKDRSPQAEVNTIGGLTRDLIKIGSLGRPRIDSKQTTTTPNLKELFQSRDKFAEEKVGRLTFGESKGSPVTRDINGPARSRTELEENLVAEYEDTITVMRPREHLFQGTASSVPLSPKKLTTYFPKSKAAHLEGMAPMKGQVDERQQVVQ